MLEFSRSSWHYRIYTAFGLYHWRKYASPKNLCRYFWATVLGYVLPVGALGALIYVTLRWPSDVLSVVAVIAFAVVFAAICIGLVYLFSEVIVPAIRNRPRGEPNLVFEYVKAKKRKFCPLIEWD